MMNNHLSVPGINPAGEKRNITYTYIRIRPLVPVLPGQFVMSDSGIDGNSNGTVIREHHYRTKSW